VPSAIELGAASDTAGVTPSTADGRYLYQRRRPELSALHQVVRDNLRTLYAAVEQGFAAPLPEFVRREFEQYLDCGLLCRGFAVLACEGCQERRLVAFSCKGRAWCPLCFAVAQAVDITSQLRVDAVGGVFCHDFGRLTCLARESRRPLRNIIRAALADQLATGRRDPCHGDHGADGVGHSR